MSAATPDWLRDGGGAEDWLRSGGSTVCVTIMFVRAPVAQSRDCAALEFRATHDADAQLVRRENRRDRVRRKNVGRDVGSAALDAWRSARAGTSAQIRRSIDCSDHNLVSEYATAYHRSLSENQLAFLHLSKSGGTGLCELAKLNGCTRPGAGSNTFVANCASRHFHDNAWWLPVGAGRRILDPNLRRFARDAFEVHDRHVDSGRKCDVRPRRCGWPCKGATAGGRRASGEETCAAPSAAAPPAARSSP